MPKSSKQLVFYESIKDWMDLEIFENMKKIEKDRYFEWYNRTVVWLTGKYSDSV